MSLNKNDIALLKWLYRQSKPVYQNDIPKLTKIDVKTITRSIYKLEKIGLVHREPVVNNKRKTYIVKIDNEKVLKKLEEQGESIFDIRELFIQLSEIPCITCPHIYRCYEGGFYDPVHCQYLLDSISRNKNPSTGNKTK